MRELDITQQKLAKHLGISTTTLNNKLASRSYFSNPEIFSIASYLKIPDKELRLYFFALKVQKTEQRKERA